MVSLKQVLHSCLVLSIQFSFSSLLGSKSCFLIFMRADSFTFGIISEAKRRKFLELHPEASTNDDPVLFRTSIVPWWAWIKKSHLPEAELINGSIPNLVHHFKLANKLLCQLNVSHTLCWLLWSKK